MNFRLLIIASFFFFSYSSFAQDGNWKKSAKTADQLMATGNYEEAANYYLDAYKKKKSKSEYLSKAATCYDHLRLYTKASSLYKELIGQKEFPLAQLKYAQSLKQNGDYTTAITAFKNFADNYSGYKKDQLLKSTKAEILGCELALSNTITDKSLNIEHLDESINTMANEYSPLPFSDEILYFSSTVNGFSKIYRSQFLDGSWTKAVVPSFPEFKDQHVCHGTFTPDNQRFYFTICNETDFDETNSICDIFVTVRQDGNWKTPKKLREYVKLEGTTATHPFVMFEDNMEVLYFSSDRKGGKGGMDIWYMTRHVDSPDYDFTLPRNAGDKINSPGDEITPFYDTQNSILYFSSNGHPTIGGYDVFMSKGSMNKFSPAQNMKKPINSSVDDYYYMKNKSHSGSFVSSNRTFGSKKVTTDNDDIFYCSIPEKRFFASGNIYDKSNNSIVKTAKVSLFEMKDSGAKRLLQSVIANNGTYQFSLIPERKFQIEVSKEGYEYAEYSFNTIAFDQNKEYGKAIYLEKTKMLSNIEEPVFEAASSTVSVNDEVITSPVALQQSIAQEAKIVTPSVTDSKNTVSTTQPTYVNSYYQGMEVTTKAPKMDGVYYKVQISTAGTFDEYDPMFDAIRTLGYFQTEKIVEKGWIRILLSEYFSLSKAREIMDKARENGYPESFVVKYRNGKRLN